MFNQRIHDLAAKIQKNGFRWVEDGPTLREIVREIDAAVKLQVPFSATRRELAYQALVILDTLYGWDAPRMDETQERAFYRAIVGWEIR